MNEQFPNPKSGTETSAEELSNVLEQFSNKRELVEIDDKEKRLLFIGKVEDMGELIEVEVLAGCSKIALVYMMHEINEETGKKVRAVFGGDKEIIIDMEDPDKKEEKTGE